jgi:hypothetical protein
VNRTVTLSSAFATALASLALAGCGDRPPVVTSSTEPACVQWEAYTPTPWQMAQFVGPDYPATINPDFPQWRPLLVFLETNNRKRRTYCEKG